MKIFKKLILAFAGITMGLLPAYSQWTEEEIEAQMRRTVQVEEPQYMPVLGVGLGYFNFYGNVNDAFRTHVSKPGIRVNFATFLDKKNHYYRGNFVFMTGELSGTQRFIPDKADSTFRNLNFKSNIFSFGLNFHYSFKPWLKGRYLEPFVSLGVAALNFDSKADYSGTDTRYYYWSDGTVRNISEELNPHAGYKGIISRDYNYETNLRSKDQTGLGKYSQLAIAIPVEIGIDFNVSKRVSLRAATSLHYAFTDLIDDMSSKANNPELPDYKGKGRNNMYTYSYVSLHVDLFSPPREIVEDLDFLSIDDYDFTMWDDQDDDGVRDGIDLCPDTPRGWEVDSVGCPLDTDGDGVPDRLDREPNSRPGAIVDEYGVEINENMVIEILNTAAIRRSDVESYLMMHRMQNKARRGESLPIPDKFKRLDVNGDGYISFDELLKSINDFFDDSSTYSPDDINELIDFFFVQ